jgi:hypothetical protein
LFFLSFAEAFDVDLFSFAELAAVVALGDWPAFLFYFEKGTVGVSACGGPVSFDAGLTVEKIRKKHEFFYYRLTKHICCH